MRIAYIYNALTSFTKLDLEILENHFEVDILYFKKKIDTLNLFYYSRIIYNSDVIICWFASWHSLFPLILSKILKKKYILITGGYDTANVPIAKYGNQSKYFRKLISSFCLRNADLLIVNSNFIKNEILSFCSIPENKIKVIYHGLPRVELKIEFAKKNIALNVGNFSYENLLRKGILPFLESASFKHNWKFLQIGKWQDESAKKLENRISKNVEIKGYSTNNELIECFLNASVYIQPSLHEGFGLSVVEAMQYGCIPIVSNYGALPEIIKDYGLVLENLDPQTIANSIDKALNLFDSRRNDIINFVNCNYDLKLREKEFVNVVNSLQHIN